MKSITKILAVIIFYFITIEASSAQAPKYLEEVNGRPILVKQYESVEGTPYLDESWNEGTVTLANGLTYEELSLKFDQVRDVLLFKGKENSPLEFVQQVVSFKIKIEEKGEQKVKYYRSGYPQSSGIKENAFYEVLTEGKVDLLKRTTKHIREEKTYNSATIIKNIQENINYYLADETTLTKLKLNEKSLLSILEDKDSELKEFIKINKLKLKEEEDVIKLIKYYNSL